MTRATPLPENLSGQLQVDRDSGVPIGTQLAWKLEQLIAAGSLGPEAQLPSVRGLAGAVGVNVNTVRSVYARLEERGLLSSEHGRGTFVRPQDQGAAAGRPEPEDREYRRELLRQIGELERQTAYYTRHRIVGAPEPPRARPASQLLPATELMTIRDELQQRVASLRLAEEARLREIGSERAAAAAEREAERTAEIQSAGRRTSGTTDSPPRIVSAPGAWVLKWRG